MKHPLAITRVAIVPILVATMVLCVVAPVAAQDQQQQRTIGPRFEWSAGYQLFRAGQVCDSGALTQTCVPNRMYPLGFAVDVARSYGPLSLVGEGGWSADSERGDSRDLDFNTWHLAGGARWTSRRHPVVWPYGQFLVGAIGDHVSGRLNEFDVGESTTSLMLQPGFGAAVLAGNSWGVVGQIDYRRVVLDDDEHRSSGRNDFRLFLGVRLLID